MKIILSIINLIILCLVIDIRLDGLYIDVLGYIIFVLAISLFGITTTSQWLRSGFIVIAIYFNPIKPLLLTPYLDVVFMIIFAIFNLYYTYKIYKD